MKAIVAGGLLVARVAGADVDTLKTPPPPPQAVDQESHVYFYVAVAAAAAAFGIAGYYTYDAGHLASQRDALLAGCSPKAPCDPVAVRDFDNRGGTARTVAITGYVVGGIAAASAVLLRTLGESEPDIELSLAPGGSGVLAAHVFHF